MKRILVVDDEDLILEVAQMSLEVVGGWSVTIARSGVEGIAAARSQLPDAIVMDVRMPGMDGPTACQHLHADPCTVDIPIILLTAQVQEADRRAFAGLPIVGVLSKPFDPMLLPSQVSTVLGWP